ncbi:protein of unknown function [Microlunatus soli]|uniref:DUF1707 domain-containing protein n=2 Tax=Microlunatus soli TaxID=630515 RepID=A0A1H1T5C7_9ACTN|nr:protein of unknown function [Microlunatus soli]
MTTVRQRIGDAERDRATECLREHMASGRLDAAEFDDRLEQALTAHYQSDLDGLFVDLPAPHPESAAQPFTPAASSEDRLAQPGAYQDRPISDHQAAGCARAQQTAGWNLMVALMWVGAVVVCATVSWQLWWLMFIPMAMSGGLHKHRRQQAIERHQRHRMRHLGHRAHWQR